MESVAVDGSAKVEEAVPPSAAEQQPSRPTADDIQTHMLQHAAAVAVSAAPGAVGIAAHLREHEAKLVPVEQEDGIRTHMLQHAAAVVDTRPSR